MEDNGWTFSSNSATVFTANRAYYCKDVPSTSYCGYRAGGDLTISYTFSFSGTATIQYGQSWDHGSVLIMKNNEEMDSMGVRGSSTTMFAFTWGDVLEIVEHGNSVANLHKLTLKKLGEKQLKVLRVIYINKKYIQYCYGIVVYIIFIPFQNNCLGDCCWASPSSNSDGNQLPISVVSWPIANMQSVGDCAQKCTVIPNCNGFHYYGKTDSGYGACYLKWGVTKMQTNLADDRERYGGICSPKGIC